MNRKFTSYPVDNFTWVKQKMLNWTKPFNIFCFLDNHQYNFSEPPFECLLAAGVHRSLESTAGNAFNNLQDFVTAQKDWIFGHLGYDLKNEVENLFSKNPDGIQFPDLFFFVPQTVLILQRDNLSIGDINGNADNIFQEIMGTPVNLPMPATWVPKLQSRFTKDEYIESVQAIRQHILRGDCYEINLCQEFFAHGYIDPHGVYLKLGKLSPNPFAAFYKLHDKYLLCSSPERYLKKQGDKILSQPIKGTSRRDPDDVAEDERSKERLAASEKERSENVMVVDLVRNDLSKICVDGSVVAEELFEVYSFPQVHQMISTVCGIIDKEATLADIFKATFPMGSMTGAPKKRVMELIEKYERTKRGLFSGAIGYIHPGGDFDFNVIIRSILFNSTEQYISIQAGSAITFYSDAEMEFEECEVKIGAMKKVLE